MTQPYVPLRVFSSFTMLEGAMEPKAIAERAAKLGFPAAALTDRNGLYPIGPEVDLSTPHDRERLKGQGIRKRSA